MAYTARFADGAREHLGTNEEVAVVLRASVPPTLTVMTGIIFVAGFAALSLSAGIASFTVRVTVVALMVAVIVAMFSFYSATLFKGPVAPYVVVGLTDRRVLVFQRDLIGRMKGEPLVAEKAAVTAQLRKRFLFLPHRLSLSGLTTETLHLDVPRIEPMAQFIAALD